MRHRRAQGASFEEIGREFGCSKSVAWHHCQDVSLEVPSEATDVVSSVGDARTVLDEEVTITVPMSIKPRTMMALWSAAQSAGYDSPDDYIESFLRDRRIERSNKAQAEMEARTEIIAARERPARQSEAIESIRRTYVEGLELVMLMRGMKGEEPPEWLFPEYYARKREEEARILREALRKFTKMCEERHWTLEQTLRMLRTVGYPEEEIAIYQANRILNQ